MAGIDEIGSMIPAFLRTSSFKLRISSTKMNKEGNGGSPWRRPQKELKKPHGLPLIRTEPLVEQISSLTMFIQAEEKLKNFRALKRKYHYSLSNAFEISNIRQTEPPLVLELSFRMSS